MEPLRGTAQQRRRRGALTLTLIILMAGWVAAGEGQGTAEPGAKIDQLNIGRVLFGAAVTPESLLGKVVVVNMGGG